MFEFEVKKKTRNGSIHIALRMDLMDVFWILRLICIY